MKVTMHSGRGSARHNDHNGGTKRARWEKSRTKDNHVWTCMDSNGKHHSVEEGELAFYEHFYNRKLEVQNARYRSKGQYGYIRSMADWMKARQYQPNETILQIGNRDESVSDDVLWDAAVELVNWKSRRYKGNYQCISMALHVDESTPHIHIRESWYYHDADGVPCPGIKAGLRELGIPLPDADRPEGKDNYRKATVDAECRSKWQEICKARGLEIDTVPSRRNLGHMGLDAYKAYDDAIKQLEADKAALEAERAALQREMKAFHDEKAAFEAEKMKCNIEAGNALGHIRKQSAQRLWNSGRGNSASVNRRLKPREGDRLTRL